MAPTPSKADSDLSKLLGIGSMIDVEDPQDVKSSRGRTESAETTALRTVLRESAKTGKPKAFTGVKDDKQKDDLSRKIRQAGKAEGMKVTTSFNRGKEILYFGPKDVVDKFTKKQAQQSESASTAA